MTSDASVAGATELGLRTDVEALRAALGPVGGLNVVDVGCGDGDNARELARSGAHVRGFDPFIDETALTAEGRGTVYLTRAGADLLPVDDAGADVAIFCFSLHHVPQPKLEAALHEARRVLRPNGRLLVAEPLAAGPSYYVSQPFHDEGPVRAGAAAALVAHAAPHFAEQRRFSYVFRRRWTSYEAYAERMIANRRFNGYSEEAVRAPEVRRRFEEMFARGDGIFDQTVRIDLFARPRSQGG